MAELKAIIFDWDGTIVDSAKAMFLSYQYAYRKHLGIVFPKNEEEFRMLVPMRLDESSMKFGGEYAADVTFSYNWYYETEGYKTGRVFPGVRKMLYELRSRGYLIGVASNKSMGRVRTDIQFLNLEGLVDAFVTAEDTLERKPHPAPLLKAADKLGLPPEVCAYVGDYKGDIIAAREARMLSVAVLWGGIFPVESLYAERPDLVLAKPEDLLDICPPSSAQYATSFDLGSELK